VPHVQARDPAPAPAGAPPAALCPDGECYDEALLHGLDERIAALDPARRARGVVVVLHQMGSHGPAYWRRTPPDAKPFGPECTSNALQDCPPETLVNAFDNTIAYTKSLCASMGTRWKELAGDAGLLGEDTFLNGDASIAAQVTRITSLPTKPDVIFFCSYAPGGPSAIRQLRAAGVDSAILTGESLDGDYWIGTVPNLSNFYVVNYGSKYGDDPDPAVNDFFKRFEAKYGKKADVSYGLRGYSAIQAWANAANKAGTLDGAKVAAVLDTFNKEPLVIGPTSYTPDLHIQTSRPMSIIGVTDGKFSAVGRFTVEKFPALQ